MADDDTGRSGLSRRALLAAAAAGGASAGLGSALSGDGQLGDLFGGTMALNQAYNVSGDLWIGPDSAKSNVDANSGRVYMAADTQVEYWGDSGTWQLMGVGSQQQPVPEVHSQSTTTDDAFNSDIGDQIDYLDPAWLARFGGGVYINHANTLDGYDQQTSGGTSINQFSDRQTASSSDDNAGVGFDDACKFVTLGEESWDKDRTVAMVVEWDRADANYIRFKSGNRTTSTPQGRNIGVTVKNGNLLGLTSVGVAGSGANHEVTLISGVGAGSPFNIRIEYTAGETCEWFVNGTKEGEQTDASKLPSGTTNADKPICVGVNSPDANGATGTLYNAVVIQHP